MTLFVIILFLTGYLFIVFEHPLKINKAASALLTGILCWTIYVANSEIPDRSIEELLHHFGEISSILFFLLGAMTIVELIDNHNGFSIITDKIETKSKQSLLWIITGVTFLLSGLLDNLTTAIVMTSLTIKILGNKEDRLWFIGMIIIAANAGGAFSPLGDVTTTMLWIGGQITAEKTIFSLFLPSVAVCLLPLLIIGRRFKNQKFHYVKSALKKEDKKEASQVLIAGILLLLFVPVFKIITHLPPFMGVLLALSVLWIFVSIIHRNKRDIEKEKLTVTHALQKIDSPSILFFLGILLAISALQSFDILQDLASLLHKHLGNAYIIAALLGVLSAIVDNVPLVAAAQGMFDLTLYPEDHTFWRILALTTGTGGSMIIIGSAAGVAAMGIENINFLWYLKKISWIAFVGFISGIAMYLLQSFFFPHF